MPAVPIRDREHYLQAIEVLDRVGGAWQGVGQDDWFLLVNPTQYEALVKAKVATPENGKKEAKHGKKPSKSAKS